jgi:hypothetical protein
MRPLTVMRSFLRGYERELSCTACRNVVAWVRLRPWALMQIRHVSGYEITPLGGAVAMGILQTRLGDAERAADRPGFDLHDEDQILDLRRRIDYLRGEAGEVIYELECPCGARYLRSLPHLIETVRAAPSGRVPLGGGQRPG